MRFAHYKCFICRNGVCVPSSVPSGAGVFPPAFFHRVIKQASPPVFPSPAIGGTARPLLSLNIVSLPWATINYTNEAFRRRKISCYIPLLISAKLPSSPAEAHSRLTSSLQSLSCSSAPIHLPLQRPLIPQNLVPTPSPTGKHIAACRALVLSSFHPLLAQHSHTPPASHR